MVMSQVQPATLKQLAAFRLAIGARGNARPTQPIASRTVEYVDVQQFYQDRWKPSENFTKTNLEQMSSVTPDVSYED